MTTCLITGATGGIGRAVAHALPGHRLLLTARDERRAADLRAAFPSAEPVVVDLSRPDTIGRAVAGLDLAGGLAALVHCAGTIELGTVEQTPPDTWLATLTVNLAAPAELTRVLLPALREAGGHVVFVNSGQGRQASPGWASYAASKFGLRALADALRAEERPHGVRVTTVYPGRTDTAMQRKVRAQEDGRYEASRYLPPEVVATAVRDVLRTPPRAAVTEVVLRPS